MSLNPRLCCLISLKTRKATGGGGAYNRMYFFGLQVDGPITGGGGGINGSLQYTKQVTDLQKNSDS